MNRSKLRKRRSKFVISGRVQNRNPWTSHLSLFTSAAGLPCPACYQLRKPSRVNYQLPVRRSRGEGGSAIPLLSHFFKLRAEHIYTSIGVKITAECDVEPVPLFAFRYSFTTSICLSSTWPVKRSIATWIQ